MNVGSALYQLLDRMRSGMATRGLVILALQFVVWVRLSKEGELPPALRYDREKRNLEWPSLSNLFTHIHTSKEVRKEISEAFLPYGEELSSLQPGNISSVLDFIERLHEAGFIGSLMVEEATRILGRDKNMGNFAVPDEVAKLMIGLAGIMPNERVYTPFDECLQFSGLIQSEQENPSESREVSVEVSNKSPFPWLVKLLTGSAARLREGDPITAPSYVSQRKLEKFDVTISFPPQGMKLDSSVAKQDLFMRFPEVTTSGNVLAIRHLISQTKRKVVVAISNSILFSPGAEFSLREYLVEQGILEAVISLPSALLPGAAIPFSILVLDLENRSEEVLFIDGASEEANLDFYVKDGKGRTELLGWEKILALFGNKVNGKYSRIAKLSDIQKLDYRLEVSRYCLPAIEIEINELLSRHGSYTLYDLVEVIRPLPTVPKMAKNEKTVEALEIEVGDFPEFGSIRQVKKDVRLRVSDLEKDGGKFFLRPRDILVSVRGKTGEVSIVSKNIQEPEPKPWVASQSCCILRMRAYRGISPEYLFMYLRSEVGRALLKRINSGSSVPLIHLGELAKLPVVIPIMEVVEGIEGDFERLEELQDKIMEIEIEKEEIMSGVMGLLR